MNIISVPYIKQLVHAAFYPAPAAPKAKTATPKKAAPVPAASTVTVDVYNGGSTAGLAGDVSQALVSRGYKKGAVEDASAQSQTVETGNQVFYGAGASANAAKIATDVGATAKALATLPAGHVEVLIGSTVTAVPAGLAPAGSSPATSPSPSATAIGAGRLGVRRRHHHRRGQTRSTASPACIDRSGRWQKAPSYRPDRSIHAHLPGGPSPGIGGCG